MFYCFFKRNLDQNNKFVVANFTPPKTPFYTVVKTPILHNLKQNYLLFKKKKKTKRKLQ